MDESQNDTEFEVSSYTQVPRVDAATMLAMASQLVSAAPTKLSAAAKQSLTRVRTTKEGLQLAWGLRAELDPTIRARPIDLLADNGWGRFYARLDAYAGLPAELYPKAGRAAELRDLLFPEGLTFLTFKYTAQWAEMERRLQRIDGEPGGEKLAKELDELCGPDFLKEVRRTQAMYGEAIGATQKKAARPPQPSLAEPLRALHQALTAYCIQLVAMYLAGDAKTLTAVRAALRPIDEHRDSRAQAARRTGRPPEQPTPPAPPASDNPQSPEPAQPTASPT